MLQKMFFVRLFQLVEKRNRGGRHVTAFADEVKYHLSAPLINATGTIRDKGMNMLIAHQSLGDLEMCGNDLNPKSVKQTILDNTPIKWVYRTKDIEAALWASKQTGTTVVDNEIRNIGVNEADAELLSNERKIVQNERNLYDTNIIQHLPDRCGLCVGVGKAQLAFSFPIPVEKRDFPLLSAREIKVSNLADELLSGEVEELL
jgi:type IV secretory pathway TraG/TraD family ATPase VirD4